MTTGTTAIRSPTDDLGNHTIVLRQLKEVAEVGQRLRGNPTESFVKVSELVSAGIARFVNGVIQPPSGNAAAGPTVGTVSVADSISGTGAPASPLKLVNDSATPGNNKLYGTNSSGILGWYTQPTGGSTTLSGLSDVLLSSPSNNQVLTYNSTAGKWENAAGGAGTVVDLLSEQHASGIPVTSKLEYDVIAASGTVTLVNYTGGQPGYVDQIMYAISSTDAAAFNSATVNVYLNGSGSPSISIPARVFFQSIYQYGNPNSGGTAPFANSSFSNRFFGGNAGPIGSLFAGTWYCTLPIPFTSGVKITVTNGSSSAAMTVFSQVKYQTGVSNNWPYTQQLSMTYVNINAPAVNSHQTLLNITGQGRYIGLYFLTDDVPNSMSVLMAELEGDFRLYVDQVTSVWAATTGFTVNQTIIDSNGNLQKVTTAGTSGGSMPTWNQAAGGTTTDSGVTWTMTPGTPNQVWKAGAAYALNMMLVDTNGNVQRCTTAGTSGGSQPTWNATIGGTTTDNSVTWTNQGSTYIQAAYQTDGTESYFMMGFYFQNIPSYYTQNGYTGTNFMNRGGAPSAPSNYATTPSTAGAFRFHTVDPIRFNSSLCLMWQCGDSSEVAWGTGSPDIFVVVYYYTGTPGSGGGGGGGGSLTVTDGTHSVAAVTSLTFSGATVSGSTPNATATITGGSGGSANVTPDTHPATANPANDEFEFGTTIDTTGARFSGAIPWTVQNVSAILTGYAVTTGKGALQIFGTSSGLNSDVVYTQPITSPTAAWKFAMKLLSMAPGAWAAMFVGYAASGKGYYLGLSPSNGNVYNVSQTNYSGASANNTGNIGVTSGPVGSISPAELYFQIGYDGSSTFTFYLSNDGLVWDAYTTQALSGFFGGTVPDSIGIAYGGTQASNFSVGAAIDWFRRTL